MPRVLLLSTDHQRGGLPLRLARLAPRLRECGVDVVIGCLASPGPLTAELVEIGFEVFACGGRGRFDARCMGRLAMEIRRRDPDLIHASLFHANLAARLAGRLDRFRPIITSTVTIELERPWHRWGEALTFPLSDIHVANSHAVADHLCRDLGMPPERVVVIPNGVDFPGLAATAPADRRAHGIPADAPLVVWAGRMDPVKNLELVVDCVCEISRRRRVFAILLGDGPSRAGIEERIRKRGAESDIRMAPWTDSVAAWLRAADVLVFPSWTEGSPNVVLEAIACGCPVVASAIPACRELLEPEVSCVDASDVLAFCAAMEQIFDARTEARERMERIRGRARPRHDLNRVADRWAALYGTIIAGLHR